MVGDLVLHSNLCQVIEFYHSREEALQAREHGKEDSGISFEEDPIRTYERDGITVVELGGRPDSSSSWGKALRRLARRLIDAGKRFLVLDLKGVTHVDEATVLEIIAFQTTTAREDCITLMTQLSDELHRSLEMQAFDPTQDGGPFESVDSAIDSLQTTLGL